MIRAFVQARMSSRRFPGKVLAPLAGRPLLAHLVDRISRALPLERVVIATSAEGSDDPLDAYARLLGVTVFRGELENVFSRFRACLALHPCEAFFRVCADSPLLDPELFGRFLEVRAPRGYDLVTNVFPRTFPKGTSLELVRSETFASIDVGRLTPEQAEHVTKVYYDEPARFSIANVESNDPANAGEDIAIDTIEDLRRIEGRVAGRR
ncbi:MAG: NTP transferase domain-containing protein [Planctomycetes bacterium]|nr:NTP transferase domain-containing protein [Planctomycetota bacterium]